MRWGRGRWAVVLLSDQMVALGWCVMGGKHGGTGGEDVHICRMST